MASHRRVDAGPGPHAHRADRIVIKFVERFAHAVEALKFEFAIGAGKSLHGRQRVGVVGRELRKYLFRYRQQGTRAGEIRGVGADFAREDGIIGKAEFLAVLDLAVPIGALHQAHRDDPLLAPREVREPMDDRKRALLIGLHCKAEPVPVLQRILFAQGFEDIERQIEPFGLFGIDGDAKMRLARLGAEPRQRRDQFQHDVAALDGFEAGMERGQLYRDAGPLEQRPRARRPGLGNGVHRLAVALEIERSMATRDRGFAQHVEGEPKPALDKGTRFLQRFFDGAAEHEMAAQKLDRSHHRLADHRFAETRREPAQNRVEIPARRILYFDDLAGQHQGPGRSIDEQETASGRDGFPRRGPRSCRG